MKSSDADTSRERKTDVSMESTPPPKRTGTEKETEKGAEIRAETEGVKEVILMVTQSCSSYCILMRLDFCPWSCIIY